MRRAATCTLGERRSSRRPACGLLRSRRAASAMTRSRPSRRNPPLGDHRAPGIPRLGSPSLDLDLLRGELYRILDELARTRTGSRDALVQEFERTWEAFRAEARTVGWRR
jgi:hypothetical protein